MQDENASVFFAAKRPAISIRALVKFTLTGHNDATKGFVFGRRRARRLSAPLS
jgi:hypothetical protein